MGEYRIRGMCNGKVQDKKEGEMERCKIRGKVR